MNKPVRPPPLSDHPTDAELAAYLIALGPPPDQEELTDEEIDARADADVAAGRFISHERMREWLEAFKKDPNAPPPEPDICDG